MSKKIFINGLYPNHAKVAIVGSNGKLEDLLIENGLSKSIKSNIYLGIITRVEPSLQAAFVDFGIDRNGFLPYSEIHYDYFQIPASDREELERKIATSEHGDDSEDHDLTTDGDAESYSNEDVFSKRKSAGNIYKTYNIQDVIKKGQYVLVQVYKDERGTKGASLTTYISLAGRYCVFMPNSIGSSGISKKIIDRVERKRITDIVRQFTITKGMSIVVRTAGDGASSEELFADYNFLVRIWNEIRDKAIKTKLTGLIHKEVDLIRQVIRDHYSRDVSSIVIEGKKVYNDLVEYLKSFSHDDEYKTRLSLYNSKVPLFTRNGIDKQIDDLLFDRVDLPSGGYIVINQTEALVAIDVNSGKSTAEKNVEDTALKINLEAASEVARQLRLRDLGGLVVIDFIDMIDVRNRKAVEKHLKNSFYSDKARVQFSRISIFGLLELSRQRIRSGINEINTMPCHVCGGSGKIRSNEYIISNMVPVVNQIVSVNKSFSKIEIHCSHTISSVLLNAKSDVLKDIDGGSRSLVKIITSADMISDQYKIIGRNNNGSTSVLYEYNGSPLSLYYYEKNIANKDPINDNRKHNNNHRKQKFHKGNRAHNERIHNQKKSGFVAKIISMITGKNKTK